MQRFAGGSGLPEFGLDGGGRREYYWQTANYLQQVPTMNASLDLAHAISDVDRFLLLQSEQLKAGLQQQWRRDLSSLALNLRAKFATVVMQKDKDLSDEKNRATELIQLLKKVLAEKDKWVKIARKMSTIIAALKQTITQAHQNNNNTTTPCQLSSSATKKMVMDEEVASSFIPCNNPAHDPKYDDDDDDDDDDEAIAVKRKKRRLSSSSSNSVLCKNCRSNISGVVLLPCRHVSLCVHCAPLRTMCPLCNHPITDAIEIIF